MAEKLIDVKPPRGMDAQLGLLLAMLDEGTNEWREELQLAGKIPTKVIQWQPFENSHSIGGVILHIADVEAFWIEQVAANKKRDPEELKRLLSEETNQDDVIWPVPPKKPLEWYWEQHDAIRKRTRKLVKELADPTHKAYRASRKRTYTLRWILHHVITHEAYHGGQAVLLELAYHRMNKK